MINFIKRKISYVISIGLLLLSIYLLFISFHPAWILTGPERWMVEFLSYTSHGVNYIILKSKSIWKNYIFLVNTKKELDILKKDVELLREENHRLTEALKAYQRSEELLRFSIKNNLPSAIGSVIAYDPSPWFRTVTIDIGKKHGIERNMPVITHRGVVGRVINVYPNFSKIMLITDVNSSIDVLDQRSRVRGILSGRSDEVCELRYIKKTDDVKEGDPIITSGWGGYFPKGLLVGWVTRVEKTGGIFQKIEVSPSVQLKSLEEVMVIKTQPELLRDKSYIEE